MSIPDDEPNDDPSRDGPESPRPEPGDATGPDPGVEELLARHLSALRAFVRLRAGPRVRALESESDLVQSVCRELLTHRSRFDFRGDSAFRSWLYTAALRKVVEKDRYHRAAKRDTGRRQGGGDGVEHVDAGAVVDCYAVLATPSQDLAAREQMAEIEAAFEDLSEEHREVLSLARIVGLSGAEVAERMGRSEAACRQLLRRAQVRLALLLEKRGQSPSDGGSPD